MANYMEAFNTPKLKEMLIGSSVSVEDARLRAKQYSDIFERNDEFKQDAMELGLPGAAGLFQKSFSGYAETPLLSTQYFNASVASYVSSFAGYMSIERDFDQPNGLFYWFDVLGVTDYRTVIPNLGPDNYQDINTMGKFEFEVPVAANAAYSSIVGRKIVPGTVRIKVESATEKFELIDNGQGTFMAVAGKISASEINYLNGKITFTLTSALTGDATKEKITIIGKEDVTGTPSCTVGASNAHANDKRFLAKMQQIGLSTHPDMLVGEYNIASLSAMKKAMNADMATFLFTKLREIYTKTINYNLVNTLEEGYTGMTMTDLDLSESTTSLPKQFMDYRSRMDIFNAYLINVETALATKAVKGVNTTAYVAGNNACNQFQKGDAIGKWERNTKMTYINDLLGWYNGIPVLRSTDIHEPAGEGVFYAIHKTADGQMAPLARGIYMPLTDTPTIGNYNNPTQMAAGVYYQEGVRYMAEELVQRVSFKMGL